MKFMINLLWGSGIRSAVTGVAMTGLLFWGAQYLGDVPPDEDASFQERVQLSIDNINNEAKQLMKTVRSPASLFDHKDRTKISSFTSPAHTKKIEGDNNSAVAGNPFEGLVDEDRPFQKMNSGSAVSNSDSPYLPVEGGGGPASGPAEATTPSTVLVEPATATSIDTPVRTSDSEIVYAIANDETKDDDSVQNVSASASDLSDLTDLTSNTFIELFVYSDKTSGTYGSSISVNLTTNSPSATIHYCIQAGSCCDPMSGTTYSSPLDIGLSDGFYCLSAISIEGASNSGVQNFNYTVDSSLPSVSQGLDVIQIQSNEFAHLQVNSTDPDTDSRVLTQLNIPTTNPDTMSCSDILSTYSSASYGVLEENIGESVINLWESGRTPASIYSFPLNYQTIEYGDNYLVSIIEDSSLLGPALYSCPATKVILKDFEIYNSEKSVGTESVSGSDSSVLSGGFAPYGGFETTLNIGSEGRSQGNGTIYLESGFYNIIN